MQELVNLVLVLMVVAAACAIPGVFLVLRRMSLLSDAIGHTLIFGIALGYFATRDIDSPILLIGAALTGLATVILVELLQRTKLVNGDAAIGLVFPAFFAIGVLLVSLKARNIHLDIDAVLLGQPDLALYGQWNLFGWQVPRPWIMRCVLVLNAVLCILFYKELKLSTFDPALSASLGFRPAVLHYGLMAVVSLTAVAAFDAVGPVLVVGFFVVPAAAALLLTDRLGVMIVLACGIGALGAWIGVVAALQLATNTAGSVAGALGVLFALVFLLAPHHGQIAILLNRRMHRREFEETMLAVHLFQHEGTSAEVDESRIDGLHGHLHWERGRVATVVGRTLAKGLTVREGDLLKLTPAGRERAQKVFGEQD
ncbi:MAG TPA: metal ABC transporter permease [Gemmata sp.]|nr:metal ABC transporter permease [Gemmata sp.]